MAKQKKNKSTGGNATKTPERKTPPKTNGAKAKGIVTFDEMNDTTQAYNVHKKMRQDAFTKELRELSEKYKITIVPYAVIEGGMIKAYHEYEVH